MPKLTTMRKRRKVESYADWMARIDAQVDHMARKMERQRSQGPVQDAHRNWICWQG